MSGYHILATRDLLRASPRDDGRLRRALPALAGGAGGVAFDLVLGGAHPVLSALLGAAVVKNAVDLAGGEATPAEAGRRIRSHAVATLGALALPALPMAGYAAGIVADNLIFGASWDPAPSVDDVIAGKAPIIKGQQGQSVSYIQRALGIAEDGKFGSDTEAAVKAFQARELPDQFANGVVGDATFKAIMAKGTGSAPKPSSASSSPRPALPHGASSSSDAPTYMTVPTPGGSFLSAPLWPGAPLTVRGGLLGLAAALLLGAGVAYVAPAKSPVVAA